MRLYALSQVRRGNVVLGAELCSKHVVVEGDDPRLYDCAADGGDEHRRLNACLGSGVVPHEETAQTMHDVTMALVV